MKFPTAFDFLEEFGIEPAEVEPGMDYERYVKQSSDGLLELDISFSAAALSFQVVFRSSSREVMRVSSESLSRFEIRRDKSGSSLYLLFSFGEAWAEAIVTFDPELQCRWWILKGTGP